MRFIEVIDQQDQQLLESLGFVQLHTVDNGHDMKKYIFLVSSEIGQDQIKQLGLKQYCFTSTLTF